MKRYLIIIVLAALSLSAFAQQKKVAVYVTGEQTGINKVLGDKLVEAFAKSGKYIAVERTASFLAELGKEQNYQSTGAVDDNELSRLGKQFGVQLVCVADVSDVFDQKYVSARLINVESAEVVNTSNANSTMDSMDELLNVADKITKELSKGTPQEIAEFEKAQRDAEQERQRVLTEEKRKIQERVEKRKSELMTIIDRGYAIIQDKNTKKYMISLKCADNVTYKDFKRTVFFSGYGFDDWRAVSLNNWSHFGNCKSLDVDEKDYYDFNNVIEDIRYILGNSGIYDSYFWMENTHGEVSRCFMDWEIMHVKRRLVDGTERPIFRIHPRRPAIYPKITSNTTASVILYREIK